MTQESQVDTTAQTFTTESAADEILNRMNAAEQGEEIEKEIEETNQETEEVDSSNDLEEESLEESNESDNEEPEAEEESTSYQTTDDLAEALEMPLDDFMANIKTKVKINGQEHEVNLSELKNGYQMESDYRRKTSELAEQRKAFESEAQAKLQDIEARLENIKQVNANEEQTLLAEYDRVNWKELEAEDPTDYLIQKQKFSEAYNRIQQAKTMADTESQRIAQENQQKQQQAYQETLNREYGLMLDQNPDWKDEAAFTKGQADIQSYLSTKGFSSDEISNLVDHRIVSILRDAIKAQDITSKTEIAKKKVKKLPKVIKPGAKQTRQDVASKNKNDAVQRFKKSGSREDLQAALLSRM